MTLKYKEDDFIVKGGNSVIIPNLAQIFNGISGFSDYTLGTTTPLVATTLGAKVIARHFILDKSIGGPDADSSLDKEEFTQMIKVVVMDTEKLLGKVDFSLTSKKNKSRQFTQSLYISKDIKKGTQVNWTILEGKD